MRKLYSGGGWQAIRYTLKKAREVGPVKLWRAMRSKNACKTCAVGMGGQLGGMRNEAGHFPEFCKKSLQAMAADMQGRIENRFFETYSIDQLKRFSPRELETVGRLAEPVLLEPGGTHYRPISWDEASAVAADALKKTKPERAFFYASGRSSNEAGFLLNLLARAYGTNNLSNCSYYCHQASSVGLTDSLGTGTATISLEDLGKCDLIFLIGGNPPSNHPRFMTQLMELRNRGGKVVVINPLREIGLDRFRVPSNVKSLLFGTEIANLFLQPKIGGDIAVMMGLAKALFELNAVDREYLADFTEGIEAIEKLASETTWERIEAESGVPKAQIEEAAKRYSESHRTVFCWTMGITHHEHGVQNVHWIVNLALLRGMVGKPGVGVSPIRGHSNVQGMGTIGVSPAIKNAVLERLEAFGITPPDWKGHDTMGSLEAAAKGEIDFALCLGGNLFGASPDAEFVSEALGKLDTIVYLSTSLNTGHAHGLAKRTLILPVQARDEEAQSTTQESMFNYVRLSDGGPERLSGPKSEVEILATIADKALGPVGPLDWQKLQNHDEIRALIARLIPHLEDIGTIGQTKKEFEIPGRVLHQPRFVTPSGKAILHADPMPELPKLGRGQLQLMTVRSEGQFNTVVYEEEDLYRGQERRDVILAHPDDLLDLGLKENDRVDVTSANGTMLGILARPYDIARGCAMMYYPEANVLVGRSTDPRSKTPAFKATVVTLSKSVGQGVVKISDIGSRPAKRGDLKAC